MIKKHFFSRDETERQKARQECLEYVRQVMSVKYGDDVTVDHHCAVGSGSINEPLAAVPEEGATTSSGDNTGGKEPTPISTEEATAWIPILSEGRE